MNWFLGLGIFQCVMLVVIASEIRAMHHNTKMYLREIGNELSKDRFEKRLAEIG